MTDNHHRFCYQSPIGLINVQYRNQAICKLNFASTPEIIDSSDADKLFLRRVKKFLDDYFNSLHNPSTIALSPEGTIFQKRVWQHVSLVAYGKTVSYKYLSMKMGIPKAVRAVAAAVGKNPILILIPCHRIIASNGNLTGYAAGLSRKKTLLQIERAQQQKKLQIKR